jgi:hypothetical protein
MPIRTHLFFECLLVVVALCMPEIWAQYTTASLAGSVLDASGSLVPDGDVTVENAETSLTKAARTTVNGSFLVAGLPVGEYRLTVEKAGFSAYVREGIRLSVGQAATVTVNLEVGQTAERVTVVGDLNAINTREATIGQTIDQTRLEHAADPPDKE